jgi:hypothetical protein
VTAQHRLVMAVRVYVTHTRSLARARSSSSEEHNHPPASTPTTRCIR